MKKILILALALGGCQATGVREFLTDPKTAAAAATIRSWNKAVACDISGLAVVAGKIEAAVSAKQAVQTATGQIYTVSSIVCESLGGSAVGG